jgi:hypothetical protein
MDTSSNLAAGNVDQKELLRKSRIAGFWYLLQALTSPYYLLYVPAKFIVRGDAAATIAKVAAAETLFRLGIVSAFACAICLLVTGLAFYDFLKPVDKRRARLLVGFVVASAPISFLNAIFQVGALQFMSGADYLKAFAPEQLRSLAMTCLDLNEQGNLIVQVLWGLWLLPLGILVFKSGWFPKIFGVLLAIGCFGYLADSFLVFAFPNSRTTFAPITTAAMMVSEIPFLLWLLIVGARAKSVIIA